jgi:branched-chain amino acid transport system permease protein
MHVQIGTIGLGAATIITVVVTAIISLLLVLFFKAPMGVQMRALAEDRGVARLLGVKVTRMSAVAWALGGGIASVAIMLHAQSTLISVGSASFIIVYGFTAAVIGGFESIGATVFGGVLLGIIQQFAGHYISTSAEAAVALLVVVTLLIVRPSGLTSNVGLRDV